METLQSVGCVLPASEKISFGTKNLCGKRMGIWPDQPGSQTAHRNVLVGMCLVLRLNRQRCMVPNTTFSPAGQFS